MHRIRFRLVAFPMVLLLCSISTQHQGAHAADPQQQLYSSSSSSVVVNGVTVVSSSSSTSQSPSRSDIECAVVCGISGTSSSAGGCGSFVFSDTTKTCVMSVDSRADFSAASLAATVAGGTAGVVYRKPYNDSWFKAFYVQVGARTFQVIQQRVKGVLSFNRLWAEYEEGFGDNFDFWIGLKTINGMTGSTPKTLRVEALTWSGILYVSEYSGFTVGDSSTSYTMTYSSYLASGNTNASSDALSYHLGMKFYTRDRDTSCTCSANNGGSGWWFGCCSYSNPNGVYYSSAVVSGETTMYWYGTGNQRVALQSIRLMLLV